MVKIGEHAVVLGASMSGLLAARVLSDFYRTVTVVDRDVLPTDTAQRRGVLIFRANIERKWSQNGVTAEPGHVIKALSIGASIIVDDGLPEMEPVVQRRAGDSTKAGIK